MAVDELEKKENMETEVVKATVANLESTASIAKEFVEKKTAENMQVDTKDQSDGSFIDPAYAVVGIPAEDIVSQQMNPNFQTAKSFSALKTSILNSGFTFPILVSPNPLYDPATEGQKKPLVFTGGQDKVDVSDPQVRKFFKWTVIDGSHRLMSVLYGSPIYEGMHDDPEGLSHKIYQRCGGIVPCTILKGTEQELMSSEILHNDVLAEQRLVVLRKKSWKTYKAKLFG